MNVDGGRGGRGGAGGGGPSMGIYTVDGDPMISVGRFDIGAAGRGANGVTGRGLDGERAEVR